MNEKKERYVGLFGEWADEEIGGEYLPELYNLYNELVADYGDIKPSELYEILSEEITK